MMKSNKKKTNRAELTAQRFSDGMATWKFVFAFIIFTLVWFLCDGFKVDPFPFVFLNLMMSMMAAIQAPIIMMDTRRGDKGRDKLLQRILSVEQKIDKQHRIQQSMIEEIHKILEESRGVDDRR